MANKRVKRLNELDPKRVARAEEFRKIIDRINDAGLTHKELDGLHTMLETTNMRVSLQRESDAVPYERHLEYWRQLVSLLEFRGLLPK